MTDRLSAISARIRDSDSTLTADDLFMFVRGIAKLAGPVGMEAGDALETMYEDLVASILFLLDLSDDELLGGQLKMQWLSEYSESLMKAISAQNAALPTELGIRSEEIVRRKAAREALIVESAPRIISLVEPIFDVARDLAEARRPAPTLLVSSEQPGAGTSAVWRLFTWG